MTKKRILFVTGTRADFGKLKSLIEVTRKNESFEVFIFATGMHLQEKYGYTIEEIQKCGFQNIYPYRNYTSEETMDRTLAKTIEGLSDYIYITKPDLIVVHGDRVETLAGAIAGSLNNILVAHIEGGELSGTIDELLRHSVSKLSQIHFVSTGRAKKRLIQMGEIEENIFVIGSPDVDIMFSDNLPSQEKAKERYDIQFENYSILMFHPVTTENGKMPGYTQEVVDAVIQSDNNYIVIYPNNDLGSNFIINEYSRFNNISRFKVFPSLRLEYFLVLLKNCRFLIGNSSAGIREAPYYGVPSVNIGTRQQNRAMHSGIINCHYDRNEILNAIHKANNLKLEPVKLFGEGNSDTLFIKVIANPSFWEISKQKQFADISI